MESHRRSISGDPHPIRQRSSQLSAIGELLQNIPIDLVMEIFSRLPLKSIARSRCVSKQWSAVLRRPDFTALFLTKSLARPQLLFAREEDSEVIFFSLPQPQNLNENVSTVAAVDHHMSVPFENVQNVSGCVNGYVCISHYRMENEEEELVYVICNPSTGQRLTLPKMNTTKVTAERCFLGYDPVERQHKVLAMIRQDDGAVGHRVLTVRGDGNMTWRMTECVGIHHSFPGPSYICINGVLYYIAKSSSGDDMIVCFDVRAETCSSVQAMESGLLYANLINFQGKLASITALPDPFNLGETSTGLEMWILEDTETHEWSKRVFQLPSMWKDVVAEWNLYVVGVTDANEFVILPVFASNPFLVYYYNFVNESIRRVEIQGMGAFEGGSTVVTFLNHVEDVKLMELW